MYGNRQSNLPANEISLTVRVHYSGAERCGAMRSGAERRLPISMITPFLTS